MDTLFWKSSLTNFHRDKLFGKADREKFYPFTCMDWEEENYRVFFEKIKNIFSIQKFA